MQSGQCAEDGVSGPDRALAFQRAGAGLEVLRAGCAPSCACDSLEVIRLTTPGRRHRHHHRIRKPPPKLVTVRHTESTLWHGYRLKEDVRRGVGHYVRRFWPRWEVVSGIKWWPVTAAAAAIPEAGPRRSAPE
jgi:hypothetical protein